ncbi:MAG: GC-type dockerin domain-anchored protein [Phycisphaerales bacterium JB060]
MLRTSLTILTLAGLATTASADRMYAVDSSTDSLYIFDTATGATVTTIGPLNPDPARYTTPISMAVNGRGDIFVINNSPAGDEGLSRVDPATGLAVHIGGNVFASISFGPGGQLFGIAPDSSLAIVSTTTGMTTSLGGPALPRLFGLDYNRRDGFFYGITSSGPGTIPDLLKIDASSGAVVATVGLSMGIAGSAPGSIAFEAGGDLVMTENGRRLWEIDIATGAMSLRASTADAPQGLGAMQCIADFDGNSVLDIFDFLAFQNAFDAGDRRADLDGDGRLTIFDFLTFQNAFATGC